MPIDSPASADLAAALAARVLHDIAGQASGLVAAFDLLADPESSALRDEALTLAEESARRLARRLALQRAVLTDGEPFAGLALEAAAREIFADSRGSLQLEPLAAEPDAIAGRVLLALLQIVQGSTARGQVSATLRASPVESRIVVTAPGPRARLREEERRGLAGKGPEGGQPHRWALAYWLWTLVTEAKGRIAIQADERGFMIEVCIARAIDRAPGSGRASS